ncbi:MAG TPA: hypothetical protein VJ110_01225 [Candidatus Nanoarchaeia archaeon]|nr:hypothetical protein [Candidatus Nanoarchaeia archaeon]
MATSQAKLKPQPNLSKEAFVDMMLKKAYTKDEPAAPHKNTADPKEVEQLLKDLQAKKFKPSQK